MVPERCSLLFPQPLFLKQSRNTSQNSLTCYDSFGLPICHCCLWSKGRKPPCRPRSPSEAGTEVGSTAQPCVCHPLLACPNKKPVFAVFAHMLTHTMGHCVKIPQMPNVPITASFPCSHLKLHNSSGQVDRRTGQGWGAALPEKFSPIMGLAVQRKEVWAVDGQ